MKPLFSEFSYGYAVTEEITHSAGPLSVAPVFPSLVQEGQSGGFDVKLGLPGFPLFLQFKLSDCMIRGNADEAKSGLLNVPFYRMHLRPLSHSQQHNLLLNLESTGKMVYYIAPAFHLEPEFNQIYASHTVVSCSVKIRPSDIGPLPDIYEHYIAFQNSAARIGIFRSEIIRKVDIGNWEDVIRDVSLEYKRKQISSLRIALESATEEMVEIVNRIYKGYHDWRPISKFLGDENPVRRAASLAQIYFDSTLFIVQSRDE